jgi:nitroreductase
MDVITAITERRSYRSLDPIEVTPALLADIVGAGHLAPSCFNNQPWRYVAVYSPDTLGAVKATISEGNAWAQTTSLVLAVVTKRDLDCVVESREYYMFDTGMATGFILLRLWDMGLVGHPIAGFDEARAAAALGIPPEWHLVTLIIVGRRSATINPVLSDAMRLGEANRPPRKPLGEILFHNRFG